MSNGSLGVDFQYQWRLLGEYETQEAAETTTAVVCPEGFQGAECKEAVCSPGCHSSHGKHAVAEPRTNIVTYFSLQATAKLQTNANVNSAGQVSKKAHFARLVKVALTY